MESTSKTSLVDKNNKYILDYDDSSLKKVKQMIKSLGSNEESKGMSSEEKRAYGAVLGAFVGDASGAPLEFLEQRDMKHLIDTALSFCGGGRLKVGPGQVTDDSEMAMCLLHALGSRAEKE
jgi:hypothetical protein